MTTRILHGEESNPAPEILFQGAVAGPERPVSEAGNEGGSSGGRGEGKNLLELQARQMVAGKPLENYSEKVQVLLGWL